MDLPKYKDRLENLKYLSEQLNKIAEKVDDKTYLDISEKDKNVLGIAFGIVFICVISVFVLLHFW